MKYIIYTLLFLLPTYNKIHAQFNDFEIDTTTINAFEGTENIKTKIDYYFTNGYSHGDRYWYEIIILDSLVILNFNSPDNDDWDFINYQKQYILDDSIINNISLLLKTSGLKQKKKGIPRATFSAYASENLFIETDEIHIAGGTVFSTYGGEEISDEELEQEILREKKESSTLQGDYEIFIRELEKLFPELTFLMQDMEKK